MTSKRNIHKNRCSRLRCNYWLAYFQDNSNGTITTKCKKNKILQEMHLKKADYVKYIAIVDMGLLWRKRWWGSLHVERLWGQRHPSASKITAVNEYYGDDVINVKGGEFQKRSAAYVSGQTKNVFLAKERHFSGIKEFSSFFKNPLNKIFLQAFVKSHFALRCKQINKRSIYHERNNC